MEDAVGMKILQTKTHFDEKLPYFLLTEVFAHLSFQILPQILVLTKLHDDVHAITTLERVKEAHYIGMLQFIHQNSFPKGLLSLLSTHPGEVNDLHHVDCSVFLAPYSIDHSK